MTAIAPPLDPSTTTHPEPAHPEPISDVAQGWVRPDPAAQSVRVDGAFHDGLQDAPCYDEHGVDPASPLRADRATASAATAAAANLLLGLAGQLKLQLEFCADRTAELARAIGALGSAIGDRDQRGAELEAVYDAMDAEDVLATGLDLPAPPSRRERLGTWFGGTVVPALVAGLRTLAFTVAPLVVFFVVDYLANKAALEYTRDTDATINVLSAAAALTTIAVSWYAARRSTPLGWRIIGFASVAALVLGLTAMRYQFVVDKVTDALSTPGQPRLSPAEAVGPVMMIMVFLFAIGLTAAAAIVAAYKAVDAGRKAEATERAAQQQLPYTAERAQAEAEAERARRRVGLVRRARLAHRAAIERVDVAAALYERAYQACRIGAADLQALVDQTSHRLDALAGDTVDQLGGYYRGLAAGHQQPALTARLDARFDASHREVVATVEEAVALARTRLAEAQARLPGFDADAAVDHVDRARAWNGTAPLGGGRA